MAAWSLSALVFSVSAAFGQTLTGPAVQGGSGGVGASGASIGGATTSGGGSGASLTAPVTLSPQLLPGMTGLSPTIRSVTAESQGVLGGGQVRIQGQQNQGQGITVGNPSLGAALKVPASLTLPVSPSLTPKGRRQAASIDQEVPPGVDGVQNGPGSVSDGKSSSAAPEAKGWKAKVLGLLSRIKNPFGGPSEPGEVKPQPKDQLQAVAIGSVFRFSYKGSAREGVVLGADADGLLVASRGPKGWKAETLAWKRISGLEAAGELDGAELSALAKDQKLSLSRARRLLAARQEYERFLKTDSWAPVRAPFAKELARVRALGSKKAVEEYVRAVGREIVARLHEAKGTRNLGFHYNLHGGSAQGYVDGDGIRATMGDIALQYSMHGDTNYKVYFFQSAKHELYDVLNERHPNMISSRMGNVLNVFDLESEFLKKALAEGGAMRPSAISIDFDLDWLAKNGSPGVGIPYSSYLAPPLEVFWGTSKNAGAKGLSRDEETLVVMRYLETAVLAPPP